MSVLPLGVEVALEGVAEPDIVPARSLLVGRVAADVGDEEIQQSIAVVVEEDRGRGMADIFEAGLFRDVGEVTASIVDEQVVATANRRDEQIGVAIVIDVGEGGGHADQTREPDA